MDTIAAIATQVGGSIGVVRISGPAAESIVARLVVGWPRGKAQSHKLCLGQVTDPISGEVVDEVLACVMRGPHSYTGDDVAELQGHGGPRVLARVLEAVLHAGARQAEPGEFTRRAFENGRIDLSRAEAVAELIAARTDRAARAAQSMLSGKLEGEVRAARRDLVVLLAEVEGPLDFPDEQLDSGRAVDGNLRALATRLEELARSWRRFSNERADVVLVGRANAGKSSLFNALVGEELALVDPAPGTTRDALSAELELGGQIVKLWDTAGEREELAGLELRGVEIGRRRRAQASVGILVVDGTTGLDPLDRTLWADLPADRLLVWSKRDLPGWTAPESEVLDGGEVVVTSVTDGEAGLADLKRALASRLSDGDEDSNRPQISQRHRTALLQAAMALQQAAALLADDDSGERAALEARSALHHLGLITGETVDTEVLDAIFQRFCIGK